METKIFLAIPAYGGVQATTMGTVLQIMNCLGIPAQLSLYPDCALIALARSELLGTFLHSNCSHMLFVDADISFDPHLLRRMLGANKDVIANTYASRHPPFTQTVNLVLPQNMVVGDNGERLLEIHSTGLGCTLVSRKAIEHTCKMFPELEYEAESGKNSFALFLEAIRTAPLDNKLKFMGEDIMFFFRLRDAGFPAFAMVDAVVNHDGRDACLADLLEEINKLPAST